MKWYCLQRHACRRSLVPEHIRCEAANKQSADNISDKEEGAGSGETCRLRQHTVEKERHLQGM